MANNSNKSFRYRFDFSKIPTTIQIPNLIEVQKRSYDRFLQMDRLPSERDDSGLQAVFQSVFPITDFRNVSQLEFELGDVAEVSDGKHRLKHGLQPTIIALARQAIHLQKAVVGALLHLDEVRDLNGGGNLGKIEAIPERLIAVVGHQKLPFQAQHATSATQTSKGAAAGRAPRKI